MQCQAPERGGGIEKQVSGSAKSARSARPTGRVASPIDVTSDSLRVTPFLAEFNELNDPRFHARHREHWEHSRAGCPGDRRARMSPGLSKVTKRSTSRTRRQSGGGGGKHRPPGNKRAQRAGRRGPPVL